MIELMLLASKQLPFEVLIEEVLNSIDTYKEFALINPDDTTSNKYKETKAKIDFSCTLVTMSYRTENMELAEIIKKSKEAKSMLALSNRLKGN